MLEFLRTHLALESRTLTTIESKMSTKSFLLQVNLLASRTAISNVTMVENLQLRVFFKTRSIKCDAYVTTETCMKSGI